jgi:hypothetical protein
LHPYLKAFSCVFVRLSAEECVSPCVARLVCVAVVSLSNLAGFCVELCRLAVHPVSSRNAAQGPL